MSARSDETADPEDVETIQFRMSDRLALLMRMAEAESIAERGGIEHDVNQAAWRALEDLFRELREDVHTLQDRIMGTHQPRTRAERVPFNEEHQAQAAAEGTSPASYKPKGNPS